MVVLHFQDFHTGHGRNDAPPPIEGLIGNYVGFLFFRQKSNLDIKWPIGGPNGSETTPPMCPKILPTRRANLAKLDLDL